MALESTFHFEAHQRAPRAWDPQRAPVDYCAYVPTPTQVLRIHNGDPALAPILLLIYH